MPTCADFLAAVRDLRSALCIHVARGGERDRKRIAIAVADAYLRLDGQDPRAIHVAPYLEWQVFEATAGLGLVCSPLPDELRCEENPRAFSGWEPLKMHPKPAARFLPPCALVKEVLNVLTEESPDADGPARPERILERRRARKAHGNHAVHAQDVDRQRVTIRSDRSEALLPRAVRGGLAEGSGESRGVLGLIAQNYGGQPQTSSDPLSNSRLLHPNSEQAATGHRPVVGGGR